MKLFELFATLGIDNKSFDKGIDGAVQKGAYAKDHISKSFTGIKTALVAAGIVVAVKKIGDAIGNAADKADTIDEASQKLGLSRKAYQEWSYVLDQSGGSIDSFGVGMKTLQNAMAQGSKSTNKAFKTLGLNAKALKKMSPEDALDETIKAFQKMPAGAEKSALALDLFGKQGMELLPVLNASTDQVAEMKKNANDLGLVLDDKAIDSGAKFADTWKTVKLALQAVSTNVLLKIMPLLSKFVAKLLPLISRILPKLVDAIGTIFDALSPFIDVMLDFLIDAIGWVADNIKTLIPVVAALGAAFLIIGIILNPIPAAIAAVVAAIVYVATNFQAVVDSFVGLWNTVKSAASTAWDKVVEVWTAAKTWFNDNVITPLVTAFSQFWLTISGKFSSLWVTITTLWNTLSTWFNNNVITPIVNFFSGLWTGVSTAASDTWDAVSDAWADASGWFSDNVTAPIQSVFSQMWLKVQTTFSTLWSTVKGIWSGVSAWFNSNVVNPLTSVFNAFKNVAVGIWNAIKAPIDAVVDAVQSAVSWLETAIDDMTTWLGLNADESDPNPGSSTGSGGSGGGGTGFATGLNRVPYDNFRARLHKDEAVLTRSEAREWRKGNGSTGDNNGQVLVTALIRALQGVTLQIDGKKVGQLTAPYISDEMARLIKLV